MNEKDLLFKQLNHTKTAKRRSAAKKLRKLQSQKSCNYLYEALIKELRQNLTWETQYHIVMAIGQSRCSSCLNDLELILKEHSLEPMVKVAIADAITRLSKNSDFLSRVFKIRDIDLIHGALRAIALEQLSISDLSLIDSLLDFLMKLENDFTYIWLIAAAPGCKSIKLTKQLNRWADSKNEDISKTAKAAIENKYLKWPIL